LLKGKIRRFAEIVGRSWEAKRKLAHNISNTEIDALMNQAMSAGAIAGKVSGAGGGGFIMFIVDPVKKMDLISMLSTQSGRVVNFTFEKHGVQSWQV
jgi:D-glycero-alpha-D-manno-heptose-7-phosphate kinase